MQTDQTRLLALTLLEIKTLLGDYLGSDVDAPMSVRIAAHLAYAVHNEAEAVYGHEDFRLECAVRKIAAVDGILGVSEGAVLLGRFGAEAKNTMG